MIEKIISGGQTGVDRAALDIAIDLSIPHGGWCPKDRLSETGPIPNHYALQETASKDYSERTKLNIRDSDGTLVVVPTFPLQVTDGTVLTLQELQEKNKPFFIVDISQGFDLDQFNSWIKQNNIKILNVAGPRESQSPGMYEKSKELLPGLLVDALKKKNSFRLSKM
ncbi:MAG: putative molybdenum carrier protein [Legionellales bacterium]